jgi:tetratricopeptide (TPR) repeat protein
LNAQVKTVSYKVLPLVENRQYELDGGILVLNTSRVIIPVSLPENTIAWYYMFASYSNEDVLKKRTTELNLASQLSLALDKTGLTSGLVSALLTPNGSSCSNIYVFGDRYNADNFVNKTDQLLFPEYWNYYSQVSIKSATHGKQMIGFSPKEQFYIGIQAGPSPVVVDVEIVAIIDESITDVETKDYKVAITYGNLGWQYYEEGDLEKAIEYSLKALELHGTVQLY